MTKTKSQRIIEIDRKIKETLTVLTLKQFSNIHQITKHFNIDYNTLKYRFIKNKSITESHESTQLLTISKEIALNQ